MMTSMVNGHDQSVLPYKCPHPKCQELYGKKEVQMTGTLGTTLLNAAQAEVQKKILNEFKSKLSTAERQADMNRKSVESYEKTAGEYRNRQPQLDAAVEGAKTALAALEAAFGSPTVAPGKFRNYVGRRFHLDSKTGRVGHFMKVDANGNLVCSCTAATFGNPCWAVKTIEMNLSRGDTSYSYLGGDRNFDARVRPASTYFRVPGYTTRKYSPYARLG